MTALNWNTVLFLQWVNAVGWMRGRACTCRSYYCKVLYGRVHDMGESMLQHVTKSCFTMVWNFSVAWPIKIDSKCFE